VGKGTKTLKELQGKKRKKTKGRHLHASKKMGTKKKNFKTPKGPQFDKVQKNGPRIKSKKGKQPRPWKMEAQIQQQKGRGSFRKSEGVQKPRTGRKNDNTKRKRRAILVQHCRPGKGNRMGTTVGKSWRGQTGIKRAGDGRANKVRQKDLIKKKEKRENGPGERGGRRGLSGSYQTLKEIKNQRALTQVRILKGERRGGRVGFFFRWEIGVHNNTLP